MVTCIMNTTMGVVSDRGKGIFRRLSLTPLKRQTLIGGQIVTRYLIILVQALILIAIGVIFFKVTIGGNYFLFCHCYYPWCDVRNRRHPIPALTLINEPEEDYKEHREG